MTFAYILLAFGSASLATFTMLIIWTKIRVVRLRRDLLEIRLDLLKDAEALGESEHEKVVEIDKMIETAFSSAHLLTTSELVYELMTRKRPSDGLADLSFDTVEDDELQACLQRAMCRFSARMIGFLLFDSISGVVTMLVLLPAIGTLKKSRARVVLAADGVIRRDFSPHPAGHT